MQRATEYGRSSRHLQDRVFRMSIKIEMGNTLLAGVLSTWFFERYITFLVNLFQLVFMVSMPVPCSRTLQLPSPFRLDHLLRVISSSVFICSLHTSVPQPAASTRSVADSPSLRKLSWHPGLYSMPCVSLFILLRKYKVKYCLKLF